LLDFGDGQQAVPGGLCTIEPRNCSYGQDHIYQTPGTYIAKFFTDGQLRAQTTVTVGGSGGSSSSQDTLTVQSGYSATGAAPLSIRFVGQLFPTPTQPAGSNFVATLDYGDGTSDAVSGLAIVGPCGGSLGGCGYQSPYYGVGPHVYNTPGTYTAKLIREGVIEKTLTITVTGSGGTTPSITITSPASGTSAAMGSTLHIAWQSQNAPAGAWVRLYLDTISIDSGYAKPATGSYDFIVPGGVTGSHTIRAVLLPEGQVNPGLATASVSVTFTSTFGSTAAPGNSQLANALTALQGALQALANVLGN
jgi:hypothetical protein